MVDALEDLLDAVRGVGFAVELAGHDVLEEFAARDPLDETIETNSMETLERRNITMEDRRFSLQSSSFLSFSVFFLFYRRIRCSRPSPANPEERNTTTNRKQDGKVGEKREKIREERREKKRERANWFWFCAIEREKKNHLQVKDEVVKALFLYAVVESHWKRRKEPKLEK